MIITCGACNSRYKYDESRLVGLASKKVKCPKCKVVIEVVNPLLTVANPSELEHTFSSGKSPRNSSSRDPITAKAKRDALLAQVAPTGGGTPMPPVKMPENKRFSLAVIAGNNSGEIFHINKPYVVIGRADADVIVRDVEASRNHARVEVLGERVILRDLNSTNGTFLDEKRIESVDLENQTEFRIGTTVFMLIITDTD